MGLVIGTGGLHIGTSGGGASPVKRFDAEAEYIKRKAGGADNIGTGKAKIPTLKGKSLVWNQRAKVFSSTNWTAESGVTPTYSNNVVEISSTTSNNGIVSSQSVPRVTGHKYYLAVSLKSDTQRSVRYGSTTNFGVYLVASLSGDNTWGRYGAIKTANEDSGSGFRIYIFSSDTTSTYSAKNPICIDLTLMFGAGNEPSTVAEFEAMYPLPYYDYNAGEIINNEAEAIETVGFNQWDEEWELGTIRADNGQLAPSSNQIRSKNYIPVFPNTVYYNEGYVLAMFAYDSNFSYIGFIGNISQGTFTTPDNCRYILFYRTATTYNNDICINLSDAARNGQYEPYEKHTLQLGLGSFDVKDSEDNVITVNGLKSAGSVFDEIDLARGKYIKRIGSVDMGTLAWGTEASPARFMTLVSGIKYSESGRSDDFICSSYPYTGKSGNTDKTAFLGTARFYIYDSAYTDAATFTTAMSGVMLYYELAEPVEYDLVTPIGNSYKVISGGTEERLPRDTASSVMAPIKYSVKYVQPKD